MKPLALIPLVTLSLSACSTLDVQRITNDAVSGVVNGMTSNSTLPQNSNYSVERENIQISTPTRTQQDYGKVAVAQTFANPNKQTKLKLGSCSHPKIGNLRCGGYVFEMTQEGWLVDNAIAFDDLNSPEITLAAGTYYIKAYNWDTGMDRYVTGVFEVTPFVTNLVDLQLQ